MPKKATGPQTDKPQKVTKLTLEEFRRRLKDARPQVVNFNENNPYKKPTRRLKLPEPFFIASEGFSLSARATLGFEGQVLLLPSGVWDEYLAEARETLARIGCEHFIDELIRNSEPVPIDAKHRITLSPVLVKRAGLKNEVLLCAGRTIEIWDEQAHDDYRRRVVLALSGKVGFPANSQTNPPKASSL
jgi:DNA-binding transcriptional regulator/RsmH inhibitor MraZ